MLMISPYFKAKDFVLFHGDAIEILNQFDEEYFDLIFADLIIKFQTSGVFIFDFFRK